MAPAADDLESGPPGPLPPSSIELQDVQMREERKSKSKEEPDVTKLAAELQKKLIEWGDAIQPHTDEAQNNYEEGDAYRGTEPAYAREWEVKEEDSPPYLKYIKHVSKTLPHLEHLANWMEVTAAPPKWRFIRGLESETRAKREELKKNRKERAARTKVCAIEYADNQKPAVTEFTNVQDLKQKLVADESAVTQPEARLLIVEDLSRDVVALLGEHFDIDPMFFRSHIDDYLYNQLRDPWVELPDLDVTSREGSHFGLQYLRARYFRSDKEFTEAERQSGIFNVLRRLDSDRSRQKLKNGLLADPGASVTLSRTKTSLWIQPQAHDVSTDSGHSATDAETQGGAERDQDDSARQSSKSLSSLESEHSEELPKRRPTVTAILLVDPTVTPGLPLWRGYTPFKRAPSFGRWKRQPDALADAPPSLRNWNKLVRWQSSSDARSVQNNSNSTNGNSDPGIQTAQRFATNVAPGNDELPRSLYDDVVYWCSRVSQKDLDIIKSNPKHIAHPMFRLVIADWQCVFKYMITTLGNLEWQFERPHWDEPREIEDLLKRNAPFRRNFKYYQNMILETNANLFPAMNPHGMQCKQDNYMNPKASDHDYVLWTDMARVEQLMRDLVERIRAIELVAANAINVEEARRAIEQNQQVAEQNRSLARLTYLAAVFIPLTFITGFLSMNGQFTQAITTIWIFFALGFPISLAAFIVIDYTHPQEKWRFSKTILMKLTRKGTQKAQGDRQQKLQQKAQQDEKPSQIGSAVTPPTKRATFALS